MKPVTKIPKSRKTNLYEISPDQVMFNYVGLLGIINFYCIGPS